MKYFHILILFTSLKCIAGDTIFVNNPNNPRLLSYKDSMKTYTLGLEESVKAIQIKDRNDPSEGIVYMNWRYSYIIKNNIDTNILPISHRTDIAVLYKAYGPFNIYKWFWRPDIYAKPKLVVYKPVEIKTVKKSIKPKPKLPEPVKIEQVKKYKVIYKTNSNGNITTDSSKVVVVSLGYTFK